MRRESEQSEGRGRQRQMGEGVGKREGKGSHPVVHTNMACGGNSKAMRY